MIRAPSPRYQRFWHEMEACRREGLAYCSTEPTSHLVLMADEMRRDGNPRAAEMLRNAAQLVAREQAVSMAAVRRATIVTKPRKAKA